MSKTDRIITIIRRVVSIAFIFIICIPIGCVFYAWFTVTDAVKDKVSSQIKQQSQSVEKDSDVECVTHDQFMNLDAASKAVFENSTDGFEKSTNGVTMWCRKKKEQQSVKEEPECLSYDQFITQDAESKTLFEKSANGLTMCRKKKEEQSPNDAQKSEGQP
jgi:hypothetical protein